MAQEPTRTELQSMLDVITDKMKLNDAQIESLLLEKEELKNQRIQILTQLSSLTKLTKRSRQCNNNNTSHTNNLRMVEYCGSFEWDEAVSNSLHHTFKLNEFRPMQREIINCTLKGNDCFVILPSGGGKSLCYQLPATLPQPFTYSGVTLVISPLISLMIDQVYQLNKIGVSFVNFLCLLACSDNATPMQLNQSRAAFMEPTNRAVKTKKFTTIWRELATATRQSSN